MRKQRKLRTCPLYQTSRENKKTSAKRNPHMPKTIDNYNESIARNRISNRKRKSHFQTATQKDTRTPRRKREEKPGQSARSDKNTNTRTPSTRTPPTARRKTTGIPPPEHHNRRAYRGKGAMKHYHQNANARNHVQKRRKIKTRARSSGNTQQNYHQNTPNKQTNQHAN